MNRVTHRTPTNLVDLITKSFPNHAFNYGGTGIVTQQERKNRVDGMKKRWEDVKKLPAMNDMASVDRMSNLSKKLSRTDDRVIRNATNANEWIRRLINQHPPSPEFSLEKVLQKATGLRPGQTISHSTLWIRVIKQVNVAINEGHVRDWADDSFDVPPFPDLESFEMLRIYGDAKGGFGTWPSTMTARLAMAGASWVQVPAENRIIPLYWKQYCDKNKIKYKLAVPGNTSPNDLKQKYMLSSLPFDRAATVTTSAAPSIVMRPRPSFPSCDLVAKDLITRKQETNFEVRDLADSWKEMRAEDEDSKHHISTHKHICEAAELDETIVTVAQDRTVTKKDPERLAKKEEVEALKDGQVGAASSSNATPPFLHGEEVNLVAPADTISSVSNPSDDLPQSIKSEQCNGYGQNQPQNIEELAPGSKTGPCSVFLSHCKSGIVIASEAIALYVLCDTPIGFWSFIS